MAREVKVEFVGSAHDLERAQQAAIASMVAFEGEAKTATLTFDAASQGATGLAASIGEMGQAGPIAIGVVVELAALIAFALTPAIAFLIGQLAALTLGALPLLALGGLAVVFTQLEIQTGRWASSTKELDAANKSLTEATKAHEQALRSLKEAQDALVPGRALTQTQLDHIQDLQKKVADTGMAVTAATNAQAEALKKADNPWLNLRTHLEAVGNEIAVRVEPSLRVLFDWLDRLVPKGQVFADRAADWFGRQLPAALHELEGVFDRVGPDVEGIIGDIGGAFDAQLGHPKSFQEAVQVAFQEVRGAIALLLSWLAQLSAWWESDGKRFARDAQTDFTILAAIVAILAVNIRVAANTADGMGQSFSAIGTTIQSFIGLAERAAGAVERLAAAIMSLPGAGGISAALRAAGGGGGDVAMMQHGGTAAAGSWFLAGEAGPELGYALPGGGVSILPNRGAAGGVLGSTYNVSVVTTVPVDERRIVDYLREAELLYGRRW